MTRSIHKAAYGDLREKLRTLRTKAGLSQRALATRLGVPHSWVAKVESGERRLDVVEFTEFAQACGANASKAFEEFAKSASVPWVGLPRKGRP